MSRRTYGTNAFEAATAAAVSSVATTIQLTTVTGLVAPGYIVLNPFDALLREIVKYDVINGTTLESLTRGLAGSAGGTPNSHGSGDRVISSIVAQAVDDLFTDIEDLETADINHVGAADPHPIYLREVEADSLYVSQTGSTMTGLLVLSGAPVLDLHAATKQYVDTASFLPLAGGAMSGNIDMALNKITNVGDATGGGQAVSRDYADARYLELSGGLVTGVADFSGDVKLHTIKARTSDIHFEDPAGADLLRWDDSVDWWEFKKRVNLENHTLANPLDPTAGNHVGDRNYNDLRYLKIGATAAAATKLATARTIDITGDITATAVAFDGTANIAISASVNNDSHTHSAYLAKSGGTMTGTLTTADVVPSANNASALGANGKAWDVIYAQLNPGSSVATTVRIRATDWQLFDGASTRAVKDNIRPIEGWEKLYDLEPVTFEYKDDGATSFGFIAEDMPFAEVVALDPDGNPKGIAYDWLTSPIIKALQDLNERLAALES